MLQHTEPVSVECRNAEDFLPSPRPAAVSVSPRNEARPLGLPQRPTNMQPQDGGVGKVPSGTASAACHDAIVADEQQPTPSMSSHYFDEAPTAFPEIKKCHVSLMNHLDCFVSDVIARLERLERPAAISDGSSRTTLRTIRESEEQGDGCVPIDGVISREVTRQLAVMGDLLRREVSTSSQVALGNSMERLQVNLKAEAAEHAAVSEAGLIEAKATMAASVDRLRETLQHDVGILHANLHSVESRVKLLERPPEQALQGPMSHTLLQQSPRCAAVMCTYNVHRDNLMAATQITPGKRSPSVMNLETDGWCAVSALVEKGKVASVMDALERIGATDILTTGLLSSRMGD